MYISSLTLDNFRNYENEKIEFSPFTNLIYGDNAQGKTNILEAVYLFSQGRSHRAKTDRELIRFGSDFSNLLIDFHDMSRDYSAKLRLTKNGKKSIIINHVKITKLSMLMNYLNVVMFSPEDLDLVKGAPSCRRRFIDSAISQLYPGYLVNLIEYNKTLLQKNSLLKTIKRGDKSAISMLEVWNMQLASLGAKIMEYRQKSISLLNSFAACIQKEISGESLLVEYSPSIKTDEISEKSFGEYLKNKLDREIDMASAQYGIQRDDIAITINGRDARTFGSQGQQRTAALSLKIAQADYIQSIKDEYPVLLLDDILSELDINRRMYLSEKIKNKQVLITSTDTDLKTDTQDTKLFCVKNGKIIR
jgi:DNA replication and repair protein RecF